METFVLRRLAVIGWLDQPQSVGDQLRASYFISFFVASYLAVKQQQPSPPLATFRLPYEGSFLYYNYFSLPIKCLMKAIHFSSNCSFQFENGNG